MNEQHHAVRLDNNTFNKVMQSKGFKLKRNEKFTAISVRPLIGPIEMGITRRLWVKANELNGKEHVEYNGKSFNTNEGKFRVIDGMIKFVVNRSTK